MVQSAVTDILQQITNHMHMLLPICDHTTWCYTSLTIYVKIITVKFDEKVLTILKRIYIFRLSLWCCFILRNSVAF